MHDRAPVHFALTVRNWLNQHFPNRWIGRGGPILWPVRSPDLNPLDFLFGVSLKRQFIKRLMKLETESMRQC